MRRACAPPVIEESHIADELDLRPPRALLLRVPLRELPPRLDPPRLPPVSLRREVALPLRVPRRFPPPRFPPLLFPPPRLAPPRSPLISLPVRFRVVLFSPRGIECLLQDEELFQPSLYVKATTNRRA
jgi:hypothetical protein